MSALEAWNRLTHAEAIDAVLPCNGSRAWAAAMAQARPFAGPDSVLAAADGIWRALPVHDWYEAFASHPRIGERHARSATEQSLQWSAAEQSAAQPDAADQAALVEGNRAYEAKFGRVFLVCATGKSAAEMLAILQRRLHNDAQTELLEAAEQQRRIMQLRLRKWLALPAKGCEDV